jgi:hypothetical protein
MYDLLVWHHNARNYMYHQANVVQDQNAELDFYSASLLKQHSA